MINISKNTKYKLIVFDLDGVLINSQENMKIAWLKVSKTLNLKIPFSEYKKHIGLPFYDILDKICPKNKKDYIQIKKIYDKTSLENINKIKFYKYSISTLKFIQAKGIKISIFTSKDKKRTLSILSKTNILINSINTPNKKLRGKPHGDQLLNAIAVANVDRSETLFIGDSRYDKMASKKAGVKFIYANYGYGNLENQIKINSIQDIKKILIESL